MNAFMINFCALMIAYFNLFMYVALCMPFHASFQHDIQTASPINIHNQTLDPTLLLVLLVCASS